MSDRWLLYTLFCRGDRILDAIRTPSHRGPEPRDENWRRPRKYTGDPVRIVGLISNNDPVDGWDLQIGELRTYPAELANELIKNRWAAPAPELPGRSTPK